MKVTNIDELIEHQIQDIYDAETQLVEALPKMAEASSAESLRAAFEKHLDQTKEHVERITEVAKLMKVEKEGATCSGMKGLIEEGEETIKNVDAGPVLDLALVGAARRVEHYESAAYMVLIDQLEAAGETDAVGMLQQTLDEEEETDTALADLVTDELLAEAETTTEEDVDEKMDESDDEE